MSNIKTIVPNVRLAIWLDTTRMAQVAADAFDKNHLCGRFMQPYRHQFPGYDRETGRNPGLTVADFVSFLGKPSLLQ